MKAFLRFVTPFRVLFASLVALLFYMFFSVSTPSTTGWKYMYMVVIALIAIFFISLDVLMLIITERKTRMIIQWIVLMLIFTILFLVF